VFESAKVYRYTTIMSAGHGMTHAYLLFFAPFITSIQKALDVDYVALGALVSFAFIAYGVGSLPAGFISDYVGHKRSAVISLVIPAIGCLVGFFAHSYSMMAVSFVLLGAGTSIYHPVANALVTNFATGEMRGKALGIHGVGGNVGMALAPILTAGVVHFGSWRYAFLLWGIIGLLVALLISRTVPEVISRGAGAQSSQKAGSPRTSLASLLTVTAIAVLAILAVQGFFNDGVFAYLPAFLQSEKSLSVAVSGLVAGLNFGAGILGQLAGGYLSDAIGRKATLAWGSVACVITFALLPVVSNGILLMITIAAMGFALFMLQPPINALVADVTPSDVRGASFGIVFSAKYGIGAFAPFVGGIIAANSGYGPFFYLLAASALVGLLLLYFVRPEETVYTEAEGVTVKQ